MKYFLYDDEAQMLLKAADLDDSGYISFVEFVAVAMDWGAVKSAPGGVWECMLLDCFEELDLDGSGRISARELRAALDRNYAHVGKQVRRHDMVPGCGRGLGGLLACFWPCCVTRRETITPPPQANNADAQA